MMRSVSGLQLRVLRFAFLAPLVASAAAIQSPRRPATLTAATAADLAAGKRMFDAQCAWCHGKDGSGGTGPTLQRPTLRHAASDRSLVDIVRRGIPNTEMPSFEISLTERTAWQTAAYVRTLGRVAARPLPGSATRGAALYESLGCATCHVVAGRGRTVGPELTSIGALRGAAHLRESIVAPAAAHPPGYLVVSARTSAGREVRGIRIGEDVFWIHIRDESGTVHVLHKPELAGLDRELQGTLMPSYESRLSAAQLDDLVAHLATLRGPS
jgi:putative heme-binding domain-containing protein